MKRFAIAVSFFAASAISASAADLAARPYTKAPAMVAEVYSWTGFYIGGDVGWAGSRQDARVDALPAGFGPPAIPGNSLAGFGILPTNYGLRRDGVIGGLYAGYNWQSGHAVFGIEGDISFLDGRGSSTQALFDTFLGFPDVNGSTVQVTANNRWLASVRGRVGYAWDRVMVYGTGGVAFTEARYNINLVTTPISLNGVPSSSVGFSQDKVGYAAGLGVEWMIAANWIARLEYLHYGFGGSTGSLPVVGNNCTVALNCRLAASTSDLNIDSVRVGLSYKFGGPVVARY